MAEETEKIYVIPLKKKNYQSSIAAPTAMKRVKQYLVKHMKAAEEDIWIDGSLNEEIWKHGKYKMPNKIRVKAVKFDDGVVEAYLPELEFTKSRREIIAEEKAKKQPILLKEEETEEGDDELETGAEDYDVVPTGDGEVKIKKKKHEKEDEESAASSDETPEEEEPESVEPETKSEEPVEEKKDESSEGADTDKKEKKDADSKKSG
jgi:large subunit ribosomal protein L31e